MLGFVVLLASCLGAFVPVPALAAGGGNAARGKSLYTEGRGSEGHQLTVRLPGIPELPATFHPCVRCHGADGEGIEEGGVIAPAIGWSRLSAPSGMVAKDGHLIPAYTAASLLRALRDGVASDGRRLDLIMPRYGVSAGEVDDLIAYLTVVGSEAAPGTDESSVRVGALLPLSGAQGEQGRALAELLGRYFARINEDGGINGRSIDFRARDAASEEAAITAAEAMIDGKEAAFCLLANAGAGANPRVLELLAARDVPVVGPLIFDVADDARAESVFYLLPSFADQGRAAARAIEIKRADAASSAGGAAAPAAAARAATTASVGLAARNTPSAGGFANAFADEAKRRSLSVSRADLTGETADDIVARFKAANVEHVVVFADAAEAAALVRAAASAGFSPRWTYTAAALLGPPPREAEGDVVTAPFAPVALQPGAERFARLRGQQVAAKPPATMEMAAFTAAQVLTEALKRSGRRLRRASLTEHLAAIRDLETGMSPPVSFGPNRRRGLTSVAILDLAASGGARAGRIIDGAPAP